MIEPENSTTPRPHSVATATFAEALVLGRSSQCPDSTSLGCTHLPPSSGAEQTHGSAPSLPSCMENLCLLGKPWGDAIPLPVIISKTRKDWSFVKGHLEYLDLGNGWILFRFSTLQDINLVWEGRPWHVSGLNLALRRWEPFFDPFSATIQCIDQWVKITRLPLELWEEDTLKQLLENVGRFIKVDDITLNRSKDKFARVCLNIDITKPLRGSLFIPIPNQPKPLEVPISYEGLHEVCALCGSVAHELEACPETPSGPIEVIVEKFGATQLSNDNEKGKQPAATSSTPLEKWITVAPKKRGRTSSLTRKKNTPSVVASPAPPSVKIVPSHPAPVHFAEPDQNMGQSSVVKSPLVKDAGLTSSVLPSSSQGLGGSHTAPGLITPALSLVETAPMQGMAPILAPTDSGPSRHHFADSRLPGSSPASPLEGSDLDDDDVTMFLNLETEDDAQPSSESTKKRRLVEGDVSSPSLSSS